MLMQCMHTSNQHVSTWGMSLEIEAREMSERVINSRKRMNQSSRNTRPLFRLGKLALMAQPARSAQGSPPERRKASC